MKRNLLIAMLAVASAAHGQTRTSEPRALGSTAKVALDPPVLAVRNDLLAQDLVRSCAAEIRDEVASRRANGEKEETIRSSIAHNASTAGRATRAGANDSYAMNLAARAALQSPTDNAFALGTCFYGRRLQQLSGAKLNVKPLAGRSDSRPPYLTYDLSPTRRGCVTLGSSVPILSDGGNTYRFDVVLRNSCATDQLVVAERYGSLEDLESGEREPDRRYFDLRAPLAESEWPEWEGPVPGGLNFRRVAGSRAKARPIRAGMTVRIPYVYDVRVATANYGTIDVYAAYCPAFSSDGYYQYMFRGSYYPPDAATPFACKSNRGAGKFVRR